MNAVDDTSVVYVLSCSEMLYRTVYLYGGWNATVWLCQMIVAVIDGSILMFESLLQTTVNTPT